MRIYDLKVEQCRSNFKDTKHKIEVTKSKQETAYIYLVLLFSVFWIRKLES